MTQGAEVEMQAGEAASSVVVSKALSAGRRLAVCTEFSLCTTRKHTEYAIMPRLQALDRERRTWVPRVSPFAQISRTGQWRARTRLAARSSTVARMSEKCVDSWLGHFKGRVGSL